MPGSNSGQDARADDEAVRAFLLAGTSSASRTLTREDLAALRPQAPPRPRRRAPAAVPAPPVPAASEAVFAGIVCFCGERFGPAQAAEFMTHLRAEVGNDLQMLAKVRRWRRETAERKRRREGIAPRQPVPPERQREKRNRRVQAQREAAGRPCGCGCGEMTRAGRQYRPGHHKRVPGSRAGRQRDPARVAEAWRLKDAGNSTYAIAAALGVHQSTASRWLSGPPAAGPAAPQPGQDGQAAGTR